MTKNYTLQQLPEIAKEVIEFSKHKVLLFYGEMGVGKTTLIKEVVKQLEVLDTVSSPTFSLVNEYLTSKNEKVYHFDFYRINKEEEAMDIGIEDYFFSDHWCFIEWPQNISSLLPTNSVKIELTKNKNESRTLNIMPVK